VYFGLFGDFLVGIFFLTLTLLPPRSSDFFSTDLHCGRRYLPPPSARQIFFDRLALWSALRYLFF
jgi:hypothetical protein